MWELFIYCVKNGVPDRIRSILTLWRVLIRIVRSTNSLSNCRLLSSGLLYKNGSAVRFRMIVKLLSLELFLDIDRKFKLSRLNMMRLYRRFEEAMMRISHLFIWKPRLTMIYLLGVLNVMLRSTYNMSNCRAFSSSLLNLNKKMVSWGWRFAVEKTLLSFIRMNAVSNTRLEWRLERRIGLSLKNLRYVWKNFKKTTSLYCSRSMASGIGIMYGLGDRVYAKVYWLVDLRVWFLVWMLLLWSLLRMDSNYLFLLGPSIQRWLIILCLRHWIWTTMSSSLRSRNRLSLWH